MRVQDPDSRVTVYEVGLRDGLQNEAAFIATEDKLALVELLIEAGLSRIELTSFVSPRWIPQLADHSELCQDAPRHEGVRYSALVPNMKGLENAVKVGLQEVAVFLSATESHSQKNINKSVDEAVKVLSEVTARAKAKGLTVRGYISTVFGCPYEGSVDPGRPHELVLRLLEMGVDEISLGDTIGVAHPGQVRSFVKRVEAEVGLDRIALHMHDTRGTALANCLAGLDLGVRTFDAAFGGLGGCPYAPGASGNIATEDLVYMLEGMGFSTGIDLDRLVTASEAAQRFVGRSLPSRVLQSELGRRAKREAGKGRAFA
ncbi:MAG: hydroxymethylglutaryl-CoA lyase [Myxococcota bacterium]